MIVDWTLKVPGAIREHLLRVEFYFELGVPARISGGPSNRSVAEYDCGERGAAAVRRAWVVVENGPRSRERAVFPKTLLRLKEDEALGDHLYQAAVERIPHE